ncbi:MAG: CapA family protein [Anaerolineales bacterium]|nr:CapA family protein [Anaerolineales bacterium]
MPIKKFIKPAIALVFFSVIVDLYSVEQHITLQSVKTEAIETISPPVEITPEIQPKVENHTTLLFTGDINLGRCVAKVSIRAGDYSYPFQYVAEKLRSADITVGSLDGSISDESPPQDCPDSMNLIGPENMVEGLQFAGFDVITVATNHVKDCGNEGFLCDNSSFLDTVDTLTQAGIQPVGGGRNLSEARTPVVIENQGIRFAFLGIDQINERVWATETAPGVAPVSSQYVEQVKGDIVAARSIADVVIVLPQWGTEYSMQPDDIQRQWAEEFINAGATLIIGNHPHIIQPMETFANGTVFYALGNFVFDQGQNFRREGLVVQATFKGSQLESLQLLPVDINYYTYQPQWTEEPATQKILTRVQDLSH